MWSYRDVKSSQKWQWLLKGESFVSSNYWSKVTVTSVGSIATAGFNNLQIVMKKEIQT